MTLKNTPYAYGTITKTLHWLMAALVLGLLVLGFFMVAQDFGELKLQLYSLHKSFGTLVLVLLGLRIIWHRFSKKPHHLPNHKPSEKFIARCAYAVFYVLMLFMPLSGWLMTSASEFSYSFFGLFVMPDLIGKDENLFRLFRQAHELGTYALITVIALHFAGALKHHAVDRDETLVRMTSKRSALFFALVGGILILTAGYMGAQYTLAKQKTVSAQTMSVVQTKIDTAPGSEWQWIINKDTSTIGFRAEVYGEEFNGTFKNFDGAIIFNPDDMTNNQAIVTVNISSVKSGSAERDEYMNMKEWFDSESFTESKFESTKFTKIEENQYVADGFLTLKDTRLPVTVPFALDFDGADSGSTRVKMNGIMKINRLDFGVGEGEWTDTDSVANPVTVTISLEASRP